MQLSILVPLFNEEDNVEPLYQTLVNSIQPLKLAWEILFIDDGSTDSTFAKAARLANTDRRLRVIRLRRNFGQTPAMAAGIDQARGNILVTMDGDLQNDPQDIVKFLAKLQEGYDIVVGWRYDRKDKLLTRKIPSWAANWLIGKITGVPIKDNGCSLKAYRSHIIKHVPLYSEMHRFIPAMTSLTGARLAEIKVRHHPRIHGVSKYGLSRIYKVLLDLLAIKTIISFTSRPLLWFGVLSLPALVVSGVALFVGLYQWAGGAGGFSVPLAGTGVLFGALAFMLLLGGVLGELIYKTGDTKIHDLSLLTVKHTHTGD